LDVDRDAVVMAQTGGVHGEVEADKGVEQRRVEVDDVAVVVALSPRHG
jgi:hypothetical protein